MPVILVSGEGSPYASPHTYSSSDRRSSDESQAIELPHQLYFLIVLAPQGVDSLYAYSGLDHPVAQLIPHIEQLINYRLIRHSGSS